MSLLADLGETNTLAADLAAANEAIAAARISGNDPSGLLDQRDQMALRLSELTGGTAVENGRAVSTSRSAAWPWCPATAPAPSR